jgi:uncharacterized delta-60 repeat protein
MRRSALAVLALAALALGLAAALALAGPGDLDRGYGDDGTRRIEGLTAAEAVAIQPDGRLVVAGWNGDVAVTRLNADGSDDAAFGGPRFLDFGSFDMGTAVALQPDGKIVVAGRSGANAAIARLNPDGSPDMGFGTTGKRVIDYGGPTFDGAEGVAVQPDGKIVVVGTGGLDPTVVVTRLESNGADDTGFGTGGTRRVDFGLGREEGRAVALQADGKIVAAGSTTFEGIIDRIAIARLTPAGSPDMGFGSAGTRVISSGAPAASAEALAIEPGGRIVVAGTASDQFLVLRLEEDGSDDGGFGGGGASFVRFGSAFARADAVVLQPDGKIVAVGTAASALAIARLRTDGALDATFGGFDQDGNRTGKRTVPFPVAAGGTAVALQADGGIVAAGATNRAIVARLEGDPRSVDASGAPGRSGPGAAVGGSLPRCAGRPATIVGTQRRDVLRGTRRADVVVALGGDDLVRAGGGDDLVCGGAGRDRLHGQSGADRLLGQGGRDRLLGGPGADALRGGAARDACLGGGGSDRAACEMRRGL